PAGRAISEDRHSHRHDWSDAAPAFRIRHLRPAVRRTGTKRYGRVTVKRECASVCVSRYSSPRSIPGAAMYSATIGHHRYTFSDPGPWPARAPHWRGGVQLAGLGPEGGGGGAAPKWARAALPLAALLLALVAPYESEEVPRLIVDT